MNNSISRRFFIKLSLAGGAVLSISPFSVLKAYTKTPHHPGHNLEKLISKNNMKWVYTGSSAYNSNNRVLDANDEAQIAVDSNVNNTTTRKVTDPRTSWSFSGGPLSLFMNDATSSYENWEILAQSENLDQLNVIQFGQIIGSGNYVPPEMGGEVYHFVYRGLDTAGGSSGTTRNLNEQIDRYQTLITIDYMADGTPRQFSFYAPHDVVKHMMDWGEPLPFFPNGVTLDPLHNQFVPFFEHLQEIIQSPQQPNGLEDDLSRLINRMTPFPNPGPNPAYDDLALLDGISQGDVTIHDNLYPTLVSIDQQDLTTAAGKIGAQRQNAEYKSKRLYKPSGIMDISYTPPMPDATLPTSMQGLNNQNHLGWMHSYLVQCDPNNKPELSFSGMSSNLQPSWMSEATGNPDEYMVHVLLQTGDQQSLDDLAINMLQIPVGIDDGRDTPTIPTTPLVVSPNYPEPFNPRTSVKYGMRNPGQLDISIYNILGQEIVNLYSGQHNAGEGFEMNWNGFDKNNNPVGSGV